MQARATLSVICLDSLYLAQTPVIRYVSALCGVRYKHNTLIDNNSHSAKLRGEIERERLKKICIAYAMYKKHAVQAKGNEKKNIDVFEIES